RRASRGLLGSRSPLGSRARGGALTRACWARPRLRAACWGGAARRWVPELKLGPTGAWCCDGICNRAALQCGLPRANEVSALDAARSAASPADPATQQPREARRPQQAGEARRPQRDGPNALPQGPSNLTDTVDGAED